MMVMMMMNSSNNNTNNNNNDNMPKTFKGIRPTALMLGCSRAHLVGQAEGGGGGGGGGDGSGGDAAAHGARVVAMQPGRVAEVQGADKQAADGRAGQRRHRGAQVAKH